MNYNEIIEAIKVIKHDNFTMDSFKKVGLINRRNNQLLRANVGHNKEKAEETYLMIKNMLEEVVYQKLQDKLGFESETINKLVNIIKYSENIEEVYVFDGYIATRISSMNENKDYASSFFIIEEGFFDITSNDFNDTNKYNIVKKLIVESINNVFNSCEKLLYLKDNGEIKYNISNLNIYINCSLNYLGIINNKSNNETIKVIVKHGKDEIYYFDIKLRDGYLVIYQNESLNKVSELLDDKEYRKVI